MLIGIIVHQPIVKGIDRTRLRSALLRLKEKAANQLASTGGQEAAGGEDAGGSGGGAGSEIDSQKGERTMEFI
jgi:hypothetical protein